MARGNSVRRQRLLLGAFLLIGLALTLVLYRYWNRWAALAVIIVTLLVLVFVLHRGRNKR